MQNLNAALRRYYRTIRSYLPCSNKLKRKVLNEIQGNVDAYLIEFPDADIAQIEARFGTPQAIAAAYVNDMDTKELLYALRIRRKITTSITVCIMLFLLLWGVTVGAAYVHACKATDGYTESVLIVD